MVIKLDYTSITKSSYINEGLDALRLAKNIETKAKLKDILVINQNSDSSRQTCWNQISKRYLSFNERKVEKTGLIKLIDFEDDKLNRELMYFNYLNTEPTARKVMKDLIFPRLLSEGKYKLKRDEVIYFLNQFIGDYSENTLKKTARSIVKALIDFGLANDEDGEIIIDYYTPSLLAFLYGLYAEYTPGYEPLIEFNILNPSVDHIKEKAMTCKIFLLKPAVVETFLQLGREKEFLNYEPRGGLNQYVFRHESIDGFTEYVTEEFN